MTVSDNFLKALDEAQYKDVLKIIEAMRMDVPDVIRGNERCAYWRGYLDALFFLKRKLHGMDGGKY